MFGMKGFYVLASGVIQGQHGSLVCRVPWKSLIPVKTGGLLGLELAMSMGFHVLWELYTEDNFQNLFVYKHLEWGCII